jgi:hypothetical protein
MPYFMPLPSGQTYLVTVPWSPSTTSVKFGFVARHTYCWTLNDALRNSGIKGAAKVTKERLSGITYFGKKSEYDLEIGLP